MTSASSSSFLGAAAIVGSAGDEASEIDVEKQVTNRSKSTSNDDDCVQSMPQDEKESQISTDGEQNHPVIINDNSIFGTNEDDTASVFSFNSTEKQPRVSHFQNIISSTTKSGNDATGKVPFPSVMGNNPSRRNQGPKSSTAVGYIIGLSPELMNRCTFCPCCRCLFFTMKETICLIMSALGCGVFLTGLILLCMYLEGSAFDGK